MVLLSIAPQITIHLQRPYEPREYLLIPMGCIGLSVIVALSALSLLGQCKLLYLHPYRLLIHHDNS